MSNNEIDIHMSDLDEETKRILAEVDSDDSKDSNKEVKDVKKDKKEYKNDDYNDYEIDDRDPLKDDSMDDKDW